MRFDRLDLNLLVALDAVLKLESVSAAARQLNLSQSAMSGSLARLRDYFGDELLVQVGRSLVPTALALALKGPVSDALILIRSTITTPPVFDPATTERRMSLIASDYVYDVLLADVFRTCHTAAPGIRFEVLAPDVISTGQFDNGEIDICITLENYMNDIHPKMRLFDDELSLICWSENEACKDGVSLELLQALPFAATVFGTGRQPAFAESMFASIQIKRRIEVLVPNFSALPQAIVGTNRLGTLNRRHANYFARMYPISVFPMPFASPKLVESLHWHRTRMHDPAILWMREMMTTQVQKFDS